MRSRQAIASLALAASIGAVVVPSASASQDLRSPDTRDAASGVSRPPAPTVEVIRLPGSGSSGFDWGDAGIGAGGIAVLLAGLGGLALTITRRGSRGISIAG